MFFNDTHDAQGYCAYDADSDRVVVSIRGSVSLKNWLAGKIFDALETSISLLHHMDAMVVKYIEAFTISGRIWPITFLHVFIH